MISAELRLRRSRRRAWLLIAVLIGGLIPSIRSGAGAVGTCGTAAQGSGTITGIVNTYFPATGTASAGATTITLGASNGAGASTAIAANDLLMVIQMQDSAINPGNSSNYGAGTGSGAGSTTDQTSGVYEYVSAVNAVTTAGGTLTIKGTGSGNGLINTYHSAAANGSQGTQTFQVIRVPSYSTLTVNITGTGTAAAPWNGKSGGVFAVDVAGALTVTGTINVDGDGFRGGGVLRLAGKGGTQPPAPQVKNPDFATTSALAYHGDKGEGTVGTPYAVVNAGAVVTGTDTMPGGSFARGAPGNAGGGGSDADPTSNDQNTGGGGGAGGGAGGQGGNNWSPLSSGSAADNAGTENPAEGIWQTGGFGGQPVTGLGVTRWTLGGGGGAGSNNDGTNAPLGSSGGNGGGVVMVRAGTVSGGTVSAAGTTGSAPLNDGGGGGGGGGTIFVTATGTITATANATGAAGTSANLANTGGGTQDHGPGGGGGGGMIVTTGSPTTSVAAGANGVTTSASVPYGAQPGSAGSVVTTTTTAIPGISSGAECAGGTTNFSIGPSSNDAATGSYDGNVPATNDNDFTAVNMQPKNTSIATNANGTGVPVVMQFTAANSPCIPHTFQVHAGAGLRYTFIAAPQTAGINVGLYSDSACTTLYGGATVGATSTATSPTIIATGMPLQLYTQYTTAASASIPTFVRFDQVITVEANGTTTPTNTTHDELYVGYLPVVKTVQSISPVCAGGEACPGSTVTYALAYSSVIVGAQTEQALSPVPFPIAQSFTLTDDGTTTNNWATNSNGLTAAPTAVAGTTFLYYTGIPATGGGSATFTAGADTKFAALIGGSGYKIFPPGVTNIPAASGASSGSLTFAVRLK